MGNAAPAAAAGTVTALRFTQKLSQLKRSSLPRDKGVNQLLEVPTPKLDVAEAVASELQVSGTKLQAIVKLWKELVVEELQEYGDPAALAAAAATAAAALSAKQGNPSGQDAHPPPTVRFAQDISSPGKGAPPGGDPPSTSRPGTSRTEQSEPSTAREKVVGYDPTKTLFVPLDQVAAPGSPDTQTVHLTTLYTCLNIWPTPFTDRMFRLFDDYVPVEASVLRLPEFVALVWNLCSLSDLMLIEYVFRWFDAEARTTLDKAEIDAFLRALHGVDNLEELPEVFTAFQELSDEPHTPREVYALYKKYPIILQPAINVRSIFRKRTSTEQNWHGCALGRAQRVRVALRMRSGLETKPGVNPPPQLASKISKVNPFIRVAATNRRTKKAADKARAAVAAAAAKDSAQEASEGEHAPGSSRPKSAAGRSEASGDEGKFTAEASEGEAQPTQRSQADNQVHTFRQGAAEGTTSRPASAAGRKSRPASATTHATRRSALKSASGRPNTAETQATHLSTHRRQMNAALVALREGHKVPLPTTITVPDAKAELLEAAAMRKTESRRAKLTHDLLVAWSTDTVVDICRATVELRIAQVKLDQAQAAAIRRKKLLQKYEGLPRYKGVGQFYARTGETDLPDGHDITSSDDESDAKDKQRNFTGNVFSGGQADDDTTMTTDDDEEDDDDDDDDDEDATHATGEDSETGSKADEVEDEEQDSKQASPSPSKRKGAKPKTPTASPKRPGSPAAAWNAEAVNRRQSVGSAASARSSVRQARQDAILTLQDPPNLQKAIDAVLLLSRDLRRQRLPPGTNYHFGESAERTMLALLRRAAIGTYLCDRWRHEKRPVDFMVRMRRELGEARQDMHRADRKIDEKWSVKLERDIEAARDSAEHRVTNRLKINVGLQMQMAQDAKKLHWVKNNWGQVAGKPNGEETFTYNEAYDIIRNEFIEKEKEKAATEARTELTGMLNARRSVAKWVHEDTIRICKTTMDDIGRLPDVE